MGTDFGHRMTAGKRRALIERLVTEQGAVQVEELADALSVTSSTIRRDLSLLTEQGKLARTYGGAMPATTGEPSLGQRTALANAEKDRIARWAAKQIAPGDTVLLDAGTTTGRLAHHLREHSGLTVVTNGISVLTELVDADAVQVIGLGGEMRHISQGFVGPLAELTLSRISADKVFVGADGLDARLGICEASLLQTRLKEQMIARAREVYVLADRSKLGAAPFNAWAPLPATWTLVTDDEAPPAALAPFQSLAGAELVTV
ncbi:DeoR/GlpR family DNA-binding transcription regulator [Saccharopolyspora halophila]|uniref:DeoR/GlpR family DNA-binding transcription regulator n=1 Tax=Saccharopolyspora halophila TaxID=405551 RepID=A0ABN3GH07_9PSEU